MHVAASIPQEPPEKNSWVLGHFWGAATIFCIYKGNSEKYKGKFAIRPFSLSFLAGRSNQHNSFARLLHLFSCFWRHPFWCHSMPYVYMTIWPYGQNMAIWPYRHMTIWHPRWPIWVFLETAIKMQQSGEEIKLIWPSYKRWEQKWSDGIILPIPGEAKAKAMPGRIYIHT